MKIIIPARKESKGFPFKNRKLFSHTVDIIPNTESNNVIVSSDDEYIIGLAKDHNFNIHVRSEKNASDIAYTKDFMLEIIQDMSVTGNICMLYLTYPKRTWRHVQEAYRFFKTHNANSLLCREEVETHPYVCLYETGDFKGEQVVKHDLCRRQEYPRCFKVCHQIAILKHSEIYSLNNNLYNEDTIYFPIAKTLDIDIYKDLEELNR